MKRLLLVLAILSVSCVTGWSQGIPITGMAINQFGTPQAGAQIRVCLVSSSGTPCTPTVPLFYDYQLSMVAPNSFSADQYGNYTFYAAPIASPSLYLVQVSAGAGSPWNYVYFAPPAGCSTSGCTFTGPIFGTSATFSGTVTGAHAVFGDYAVTSPFGANTSLANLAAYSNLTGGYSIVGDSTWVLDSTHGATDYTLTSGFKVASALDMPIAQDYAIAGAGAADCFPTMITPNGLNPGPGYGTIPNGQGWSILSLGINNFGAGTSSNVTGTYVEQMTACAEWLGVARKYKVMATDPPVTLAGGFSSSNVLINGGAISTTSGATATFPITTSGNKLHILYGIYVQGAVIAANYVSGGSVTGAAGTGCFIGSFNNGSTVAATIVLTGTNTLAGAALRFNLSGAGGTGATAAPTTAVLSNGSATCSGTITISSTLGLGGATGAPLPQASVTIDGVPPSSGATLLGQGVGGYNFSSIINLNTSIPTVSTIADSTYAVTAGTHTVVVTTQNTGPFTIGGVLSQGSLGVNPPAVAIGGVLHQNACASDTATAAYDSLNQSIAASLQADGIIAPYVNDRAAVGCGVDGTLANAGMTGVNFVNPDGTTTLASTSPGSHPNNSGYESRTQAFKQALAMFTQSTQGALYNTLQADGRIQVIQTSLSLPQWMAMHNLSFVNSGAWPILSGYDHTNFSGAPGIIPWHVYYDSNNVIFDFAISPQVAAVVAGVVQAGKEVSLTNLFQIKLATSTPGTQTFYPEGNGSPTEHRFPGIQSQQFYQPQIDNHPAYASSLAFNMGYSLSTTALTGNVATMTLNQPYVTSLGGQAGTIGFCNGASPFTVAAPSNFDVTRSGYSWPFASTANFDTTNALCNEVDIIYNQAQASWQTKPYANVHLTNAFSVNQSAPVWIGTTGFSIPGATTVGHYLRNNGTNYVDGAIQTADLPAGTAPLVGLTGSTIGGSPLGLNACASATGTVTGATTGMHVFGITPATDPNSAGTQTYDWYGRVTSSNNVTIYVCALAAGTPAATLYNFLVQ